MHYTRRHLLKSGTALAAMGAIPRPLLASLGSRPEPVPPIEDPRIRQLAAASIDTAQSAGVTYADARLTHTYVQRFGVVFPIEEESMTFGVRVLVEGYWGFASSPVWSADEAVRLTRAAIGNARANTIGKKRTVELAPVAPLTSGHWTTPIKDDVFAMSRDEIEDFFAALVSFMRAQPGVEPITPNAEFVKQDKAFASTAGQYCTQRIYQSGGTIPMIIESLGGDSRVLQSTTLECITRAGLGFEYFRDQPLEQEILKLIDETRADLALPAKPVDVGRYPVVFDAMGVAKMVSETVGAATELDRALGYEANAGGTSYISEPLDMVGTYQLGAPIINVTANRSAPGSVATVKWDDEGVVPEDFTLVRSGVLADMQTDREGAGWIRDLYVKQQRPFVSRGCSYAPSAMMPQLTHCANLVLSPGETTATFDSLIAGVPKGIAFKRANVDMDFQQVTGLGEGLAFEIRNGKRVAILRGAGFIFRTPELWKSVAGIGGAGSSKTFGQTVGKGQPNRTASHSVTAPPMMLKEITIIDSTRKA